jgi:hypothetical protein
MKEAIRTLQNRVNAALLESDWETLNDLSPRTLGSYARGASSSIGTSGSASTGPAPTNRSSCNLPRQICARTTASASGSTSSTLSASTRGKPTPADSGVTQVWVTDHGGWELAAVQYTSIR